MTIRAAVPQAPPATEAGRPTFGKYEILRRIAMGGMAEIFLARARGIEGFEKLLVLKRILPQFADNEEFVQMFLDEARLAAHLHHTNVVQVYDIGRVDNQYFLSMEFLHGQDTRQLMKAAARRNEPIPLEHALTIMVGVLSGLHYAHTRVVDGKPLNLVHRDISPQNVLVTYDGGVKLLDFGIARASSRLSETRTGTLKGKTSYMSPEQVNGLPLDRRSDVFAAAIMLWELTTNRRLFTGDSELEILRKIREDDPPRPSAHAFAYPLALERIVLKGLRRNWEYRWQSAEEMQQALENFAREAKITLSPLALARYMRDLFADKIQKWQDAERAGIPLGDHLAEQSGSRSRVATVATLDESPPLIRSRPDVPQPPPRSRSRTWVAVAAGVAVGSLVTWLLSRQPSAPMGVSSLPTVSARVEALPAVEKPQPVEKAATAPRVVEEARAEKPAPVEKMTAAEKPGAVERSTALEKPTAVEKPPAVEKPIVEKRAVEKPAVEKPTAAEKPFVEDLDLEEPALERAAPVERPTAVARPERPIAVEKPAPRTVPKRPAARPATPKPHKPSGWDPDSMLPP
jgi:serine/threonine protein kinase